MPKKTDEPITLGDKLPSKRAIRVSELIMIFLISGLVGVALWWGEQNIVTCAIASVISAIFLAKLFLTIDQKEHFLIHSDWNGFMKSLKLANKTALFDGSNIYHLGLEHGVGAKPLKALIQRLRADGYRIICFFDANIYFTLRDNNEFQNRRERFSPAILQRLFGLEANEIYVVPSKLQADLFIVETLSQRWSRKFGPVVKVDRLMRKTIQNDETKEPFSRIQSPRCA
ncbi:hypothetical protein [Profundibacter sp.]|uniref:hypothetical protein n=1 Tax=Profundibacter sp. TaxID=3101071 RepID=UPI003D0BF8B8